MSTDREAAMSDDIVVPDLALDIAETAPGSSRRGVLRAGTLGAALLGAAGATRGVAGAATPARPAPALDLAKAAAAAGPTLFYVRDAARGEIGALVGEREVVITDAAAVHRILTAAGS